MAQLEAAEIIKLTRTAVAAVASDDLLAKRLVLKGGNALQLVHKIGFRASQDLDFSMEGDFDDHEKMGERLKHALFVRFAATSYRVVAFKFAPKPQNSSKELWGGYNAVVQVLHEDAVGAIRERLVAKLSKRRALEAHPTSITKKEKRSALRSTAPVEPSEQQISDALLRSATGIKIDVSKFEYCEGKEEHQLDGVMCFVVRG